ncbi:hypothetical protein C1X05_13230 [Laceyella sacchari]|jgi:hypothetical protein|uniref:Uncharacterized protein n=2 Tax=Laceyella TaxID=292635 RepID=A0AA45WMR9_9BACL|nr:MULTISPECIES: hypothetical protein [Laceyella]AUS09695.1 hypothetical protein C1X05_13230 [Laceyella sacchari]MRG27413.1 hypothetical protein [Laceyella tengchongensis]PRZ17395.1 hypothetical protein CLV36_101500 [Laceyella sediminis]SMP14858.1 hypothetical protein SAMN06265361_102630 [Laceyella tengchongensis]
MQAVTLSRLVLDRMPEIHELLTETEKEAQILIYGEVSALKEEEIYYIVAETIAKKRMCQYYH